MGTSTYGFIIVLYNLFWKASKHDVVCTDNEIISGEVIADENIYSLTNNNNNNNNNNNYYHYYYYYKNKKQQQK